MNQNKEADVVADTSASVRCSQWTEHVLPQTRTYLVLLSCHVRQSPQAKFSTTPPTFSLPPLDATRKNVYFKGVSVTNHHIMATLNKVMLIGNLTRDPELRYTPKGSAVADMSIAVNRSFSNDGGQKTEETTFVDVVAWAKLAELAGQYLQKGRSVFVEGRLQADSWEDKATGQKRSKLRVVAENLQFLNSREDGEKGAQAQEPPRQQGSRSNSWGNEGGQRQQGGGGKNHGWQAGFGKSPPQKQEAYTPPFDDSSIPF